jgi:hypothetical protein
MMLEAQFLLALFLFTMQQLLRQSGGEQGCQIYLDATYQNGENLPNGHKIYHIAAKYNQQR